MRHNIVCIEGVDRCGKSSFAKWLSSETGWPVIHFGVPPKENLFGFFYDRMARELLNHGTIILDRSFISNLVYGKINGNCGGGSLTDDERIRLERFFGVVNTILIVMHDEPEAIHARILADTEKACDLTPAEITTMQQLYDDFADNSLIPMPQRYRERLSDLFEPDGTPKPVVLTFENILRNVCRIGGWDV